MLKGLVKKVEKFLRNANKTFMKQHVAVRIAVIIGLIIIVMKQTHVGRIGLTSLPNPFADKEGMEGKKQVIFFHMNGCGHCTKFKPEWSKFESKAASLGVSTKQIEASDASGEELRKKYKVEGYPTVVLVQGGQHKTFEGDRTADALEKFVKDN